MSPSSSPSSAEVGSSSSTSRTRRGGTCGRYITADGLHLSLARIGSRAVLELVLDLGRQRIDRPQDQPDRVVGGEQLLLQVEQRRIVRLLAGLRDPGAEDLGEVLNSHLVG